MCTFDPRYASRCIAPRLSTQERIEYLSTEIDKIVEMLDGADDCKWIYQSLIHMSMLYKASTGSFPPQANNLQAWVGTLKQIDPLRAGRWNDLITSLQ